MTLHSPRVHGFFSVPVDHLHALRELASHFAQYYLPDGVVVSPDLGTAKSAPALARMLGLSVAAGAKQRFDDDRVSITSVIGDVTDRDVIVDVLEIVCTNTVPIPPDKRSGRLRVLSIASALAEATRRIHNGESVSTPFHPS